VHLPDLADGASLLLTRTGMIDAAPRRAAAGPCWRFR